MHADVIGPFRGCHAGNKYALILVDDHSRYMWVFPPKIKSDVFATVKYWVRRVQKQLGQELCALQTDLGGEFMSNEFAKWLQQGGIQHRMGNVHVPQETGVAERHGGLLQTKMHAMLQDAGLSLIHI